MDNLIFFIMGLLLMYLMLQKPLNIHIHHTHETLTPDIDMDELEDKMFTKDPESDKMDPEEQEINKLLAEVNDVMGGSDR